MDTITISRAGGLWVADQIRGAFGTCRLPTPYDDRVAAEQVVAALQARNPGYTIHAEG